MSLRPSIVTNVAPAAASSGSSGVGSGQGSGSGSPTSIGTVPDQNGERHTAAPGSSQASSAHCAAAARSAPVCTLSGNAPASKRGGAACAAHAAR